MARTRCGDWASSSLKLKWPLASVLVRPASSMPCASLSRTTSSPAEGLPVVEFLTVPVRVCAEAKVVRRRMVASDAKDQKNLAENALRGRIWGLACMGPFDFAEISLREVSPSLRLTCFRENAFKIWVLFAAWDFFPGGRSPPGWWQLRLAEKISRRRNPHPGLYRLCIRS